MAVTSSYAPAIYSGNGSTTFFPVPWKFMANSDLVVTTTDASGVVTTLSLGGNYTAAGAGEDSGGSITFTTAPASGLTVTIARVMPLTQPVTLPAQGPFYPETHEAAFDRLTLEVQQLDADRATLATKEAADIATLAASVAAIGSSGATPGDTSSILAFGSTRARTLTSRFADKVNVLDYTNVDNSGATDTTSAVMACINENKGKRIYFPPGLYRVAGILLTDSSYDGTQLICDGGQFLLAPDAGSNFQSAAWVGIAIGQIQDVLLDLDIDGNSANMSASEHIYPVGVAGAINPYIRFRAKNIRGDVVYVGQSLWGSSSSNPTNVTIRGRVDNASDDGRNAVSLISCTGFDVDVESYGVGGVIGGVTEPGGVDLEPDFGYQSLTNGRVRAKVITGGTCGFQVLGKSISGNDSNRDWNISNVEVDVQIVRTGSSSAGLAASNLIRASGLRVKAETTFLNGYGTGYQLDFLDDTKETHLGASHVNLGVRVGPVGEVRDADINLHVAGYSNAALRTTQTRDCTFRGKIDGSVSVASSTPFAIVTHNEGGTVEQVNTHYLVDAPYDGVNARAFRNETSNPVTFDAACRIRNCNYSGYASHSTMIESTTVSPFKENVIGVDADENGGAYPSNGRFNEGEWLPVKSTADLDNTGRVKLGYKRLTTGNTHTQGVDWAAAHAEYQSGSSVSSITANGQHVSPDVNTERRRQVNIGSGVTAYNIDSPLNPVVNARMLYCIINGSGGASPGTTWDTVGAGASLGYQLSSAWVDPANGKRKYIEFESDVVSGKWIEMWRGVDV